MQRFSLFTLLGLLIGLACPCIPSETASTPQPPSPKWFSHYLRNVPLSPHRRYTIQIACLRTYNPTIGRYHYQADGLNISLFKYVRGRAQLVRSTRLNEGCVVLDVKCVVHRRSGHLLLAIEGNGGQHNHTHVYRIKPRTFRLQSVVSRPVLYGDTRRLAVGLLVENCPDPYVGVKPKGFKRKAPRIAEYLRRHWVYHPRKQQFLPGKYYLPTP